MEREELEAELSSVVRSLDIAREEDCNDQLIEELEEWEASLRRRLEVL